jgi:hypothetical protein
MSEGRDRRRELWGECRRKQRYRTVESIERSRIEREQATGVPLRFYACRFCGCYHLTKDWRRVRELRQDEA